MPDPKKRESKAERFKRLANARVNRATKDLRTIGNLANRSNYEYGPAQVRKIIDHLRRELKELEAKFDVDARKNSEFNL